MNYAVGLNDGWQASSTLACPSCDTAGMRVFYTLRDVPSNSCVLMRSAAEARGYPKGNIELAHCAACGFICNSAFDAGLTEYSGRYEETQGFSPTFNAFHEQLAQSLVTRHGLKGKDIIEIGCGKGEFLRLMCRLGHNRGLGFDPGYSSARGEEDKIDGMRVIQDFFSDKYTRHRGDFICCKMTLEHIYPTSRFIGTVTQTARDSDSVLFFQVPEAMRIFRDCAFEDIYYEHCSYFSAGSLARLFRRHGFEPINIETAYDAQYLTIEARRARDKPDFDQSAHDDPKTLAGHVSTFAARCTEKVAHWRAKVDALKSRGAKVVIWGSGSKAVSFLGTLRLSDEIEYVVDINPFRQDHYMPGTGHRIVGPEFLKAYRPEHVIVMNRVYVDEIARSLQSLGLEPTIDAL